MLGIYLIEFTAIKVRVTTNRALEVYLRFQVRHRLLCGDAEIAFLGLNGQILLFVMFLLPAKDQEEGRLPRILFVNSYNSQTNRDAGRS